MSDCGCRYGANQYAAWYSMCEKHHAQLSKIAGGKGISVEQALEDAIRDYLNQIDALTLGGVRWRDAWPPRREDAATS